MLCKVIEDPYYRHLFKYVNIYCRYRVSHNSCQIDSCKLLQLNENSGTVCTILFTMQLLVVQVGDTTVYKRMCAEVFLLKDVWRFREPKVSAHLFIIHEISTSVTLIDVRVLVDMHDKFLEN